MRTRPYVEKSTLGGIWMYPHVNQLFIGELKALVPQNKRDYGRELQRWYVGPEKEYTEAAWELFLKHWPLAKAYSDAYRDEPIRRFYSVGAVSLTDDPNARFLQVVPEACPEVIRAAYKALAKRYHPDAPQGSGLLMTQLNNAMDQLRREGRA